MDRNSPEVVSLLGILGSVFGVQKVHFKMSLDGLMK